MRCMRERAVLFVVSVVFVLVPALLCGFVPLASARFTTVLRVAQKTGMSRGGRSLSNRKDTVAFRDRFLLFICMDTE